LSTASFFLVVLAALAHATWNLLAKRAAAAGPTFVFFYSLAACVAYAPWVFWLLAHGELNWNWAVAICVMGSGLIHLAYNLSLQRGYQVADLSVVYPIARGTGPMLSSVCAFLLLGETATGLRLSGLFAVVAGIGLISTQGDLTAFKKPRGQAGVWWGTATGGLIACYTVVDAYSVRVLGVAPVFLDWCSNLLRFVLLAPVVTRNAARSRELMRGKWWLAVGVGVLSSLSYILVLGALQLGAPVSVVAPAREMSMMVGALFGMLILRERVGPWRLVGCAALMAGTLMLSAS
jgi:drug/metabolite transporter (DMT)-like permease